MSEPSRAGERALSFSFAALSGGLTALAGAPFEASWLGFLAPAALAAALEPRLGHPLSPRAALATGLVAGFSTHAALMYWVVGLLEAFAGFPTPLALLVGAILWAGQSLPYVGVTVGASALARRGVPLWLGLPACFALSFGLAPALFPWHLALSQLGWLPYAQVAELGGAPLLDLLIALVGASALAAARERRLAPTIACAAALLLPPAYGAIRLPMVHAAREAAPRLAVGVAQPNVSIIDKYDRRLALAQLSQLQTMTLDLEAEGAELVLWPESSYPFPILREAETDRADFGARPVGARAALLAGALSTDGQRAHAIIEDASGARAGFIEIGLGDRYNSAVGFDAAGRVVGIADKVRLLAFGEYVPFWDWLPPLQEHFPRGLRPGEGAQVLELAGARVGVLNCYEDLLTEHVRQNVRAGPELLVNLTNNAWFGDTSAPHLHHMAARLRAIETRRDLVRAVNTGVSGHTLATGEDAIRTPTFVEARFVADARLLDGQTPWTRWGDLVTPALAGALLGVVLALRRRRSAR